MNGLVVGAAYTPPGQSYGCRNVAGPGIPGPYNLTPVCDFRKGSRWGQDPTLQKNSWGLGVSHFPLPVGRGFIPAVEFCRYCLLCFQQFRQCLFKIVQSFFGSFFAKKEQNKPFVQKRGLGMRILMISNHLGVQSGVQRYVQNLLLHLDTARYQVDLFVGQCPPDQASTAPALEAKGVHIIAVPDHKKDRIRALWQHLRTHKDYDIIHYHTASKIGAPVCGMMRLLCPRAKIIVHSHIVYPPLTLTWRVAHGVYQLFADYFLGCGVAAGRFVFGDHIDRKPNFAVACNAVDQGRFHPDAAARAATRKQYGIADTDRLAGFVGRLNHQKNPLFLMEVFAALADTDPAWKLLLVGTGEMEEEMRAAAARRGLTDRVIFAGVQSDVPAYMNAFDLFLLPSNFEGSPVTLVEAQGCGVPCLASTNVPNDGAVTDLVHFLPLDAPLNQWAATANGIAGQGDHADHWAELSAAGYELHTAAARMEQLYDQLGGRA